MATNMSYLKDCPKIREKKDRPQFREKEDRPQIKNHNYLVFLGKE